MSLYAEGFKFIFNTGKGDYPLYHPQSDILSVTWTSMTDDNTDQYQHPRGD